MESLAVSCYTILKKAWGNVFEKLMVFMTG